MFENDDHGVAVAGEKQELKMAVLRGASVRVILHDLNVEPSGTNSHVFTSCINIIFHVVFIV